MRIARDVGEVGEGGDEISDWRGGYQALMCMSDHNLKLSVHGEAYLHLVCCIGLKTL